MTVMDRGETAMTMPVHLDEGAGSAVMFCHGALMDHSMFKHQVEALSPAYRCISFDMRPVRPATYSLADLVDECLGLMGRLRIDRFVLAGLSMGGFVGIELALRQSHRLAGLVLMDTMAADYTMDERRLFGETFAPLDADGLLPADFINAFVPVIFSQRAEDQLTGLVAHWKERWAAQSARSILLEHRAWLAKADYRPRLPELRMPTLILHGADDRGINVEHARVLNHGIQGSELVELPGVGHAITEEAPEPVNQALRSFLDRILAW
jgi:pimeloyl-ACP methyl ester carboxylesterase